MTRAVYKWLLRAVIAAAWLFFGTAEATWLLGAPGDVQLPLYRVAAGFFVAWLLLRWAWRTPDGPERDGIVAPAHVKVRVEITGKDLEQEGTDGQRSKVSLRPSTSIIGTKANDGSLDPAQAFPGCRVWRNPDATTRRPL